MTGTPGSPVGESHPDDPIDTPSRVVAHSVIGGPLTKALGDGGAVEERYLASPERRRWWDGLQSWERDLWSDLIPCMSREERLEFDRYRVDRAFFWPRDTQAGVNERNEAERLYADHWRSRVKGRVP